VPDQLLTLRFFTKAFSYSFFTKTEDYCHSSSQIEIELKKLEADANFEKSKSAFYYMSNRVYSQCQEATLTQKQEHETIINFKIPTKIPR
jgi:hypothetical protein